jgi:phosphoglucomutase
MIKFGTSGWRGIIGEDFTFENVRVASQGIASFLRKSGQQGSGVIVAYDTRFLSEKFASEAAKILAFNGIKASLRATSPPCVSYRPYAARRGRDQLTASLYRVQRPQVLTSNGAPALPDRNKIEREIHLVNRRTKDGCYGDS